MLHIVNGDATATRVAPAALPGDVVVWRDILVEGPVDGALGVDALAARRAPWLARRLGIPPDDYVANGRAQAAGLARALSHDELVLWFEQDLFCVANLAHLAAWLHRARPQGRVSLVFPADPLGTTESATLAALFAARGPFTDDAIAHAAAWWEAYASANPSALEAFAARAGALPFLHVAARLHLARFPAVGTGLGAVEAAVLAVLDDAPRPFAEVFRAATQDERMRGHGMADLQLAAYLHALTDGPAPLVRITNTAADGGLGGVPLEGHRVPWRWDASKARLVRA